MHNKSPFAAYEEKILAFLKRFYFFVLPVSLAVFYLIARFKWDIYWKIPSDMTEFLLSAILSLLFLVLVVLFVLKLKVGNKMLCKITDLTVEIPPFDYFF